MLINEEIYGNVATVYHRAHDKEVVKYLKEHNWTFGKGAGNMYGKGIYCCFTTKYAGNAAFKDSYAYGPYLFKGKVSNLQDYFIFNKDIYKKVYGKEDPNFIETQNKKFGLNVDKEHAPDPNDLSYRNRHNFSDLYLNGNGRERVRGIIFYGANDGPVLIAFNPYEFHPMSMMYDPKGTLSGSWEKVEHIKLDEPYLNMTDKDNPKNFVRRNKEASSGDWIMKKITDKDSLKDYFKENNFITKSDIKELTSASESYSYKSTKFAFLFFNKKTNELYLLGFTKASSRNNVTCFDGNSHVVPYETLEKKIPESLLRKVTDGEGHNIFNVEKDAIPSKSLKQKAKYYNDNLPKNIDRYTDKLDKLKSDLRSKAHPNDNRYVNSLDLNKYLNDPNNYGKKSTKQINDHDVKVQELKNFSPSLVLRVDGIDLPSYIPKMSNSREENVKKVLDPDSFHFKDIKSIYNDKKQNILKYKDIIKNEGYKTYAKLYTFLDDHKVIYFTLDKKTQGQKEFVYDLDSKKVETPYAAKSVPDSLKKPLLKDFKPSAVKDDNTPSNKSLSEKDSNAINKLFDNLANKHKYYIEPSSKPGYGSRLSWSKDSNGDFTVSNSYYQKITLKSDNKLVVFGTIATNTLEPNEDPYLLNYMKLLRSVYDNR